MLKKISRCLLPFFLISTFAQASPRSYDYEQPKLGRWVAHDLPYDLWGDTKKSFWGWGGAAFVAGSILSASLVKQDDDIQKHFDGNPIFDHTGDRVIGAIASPYALAGVSVLGWGIGRAVKNVKFKSASESFLEAFFLSESLTLLGKTAFGRDRPNGGSLGFPSAHTAGAFSLASVLEVHYGPLVGIPAYAGASLVGLSRLDGNDHFTSDVIMGAVIGGVIGWGTASFHKNKMLSKVQLAPTAGAKQTGLNFVGVF